MHPEWERYLLSRGARIAEGRTIAFNGEAVNASGAATVIADLSHLGLIAARGPDLDRFFQNQFTNDLREVGPGRSQISAYCTPQGRVVALFRVFQRDGITYLQMPAGTVDPTLARLLTYRLRARVDLSDASRDLVRIGLAGPTAPDVLTRVRGTPPAAVDDVVTVENTTLIRLPGPHPRFEIVVVPEDAPRLWQELTAHAAPVGADAWELLDIRAGLPAVRGATVEAFVPQMVNLHWIGGLSFTKGCYPGQEIVARMHYRGQLKRRMYRARVAADRVPEPGEKLHARDATEGQAVGRVVSAARSPEGRIELLAVIETRIATSEPVHLDGPDGPTIEILPLPYPTDDEG